ncbi:hypothetical protein D3C80_2183000 [compost metagenome]
MVIGEKWELTLKEISEEHIVIELLTVHLEHVEITTLKVLNEPFSLSKNITLHWKKGKGKQIQFFIHAPTYIHFYRC